MNTNGHPTTHVVTAPTNDAPGESSGSRKRRFALNITPVERGGRILIGLAAVIAAVIMLASAGTAFAVVLEMLLIVAGLDLVVTGALGHCPLYQRLGHEPASLRRSA